MVQRPAEEQDLFHIVPLDRDLTEEDGFDLKAGSCLHLHLYWISESQKNDYFDDELDANVCLVSFDKEY